MGNDKLFNKNRERAKKDLARKKQSDQAMKKY